MRCSGHYTADIYVYNINPSIKDRVVSYFKVCCTCSCGANIKVEMWERCANTHASEIIGENTSSKSNRNRTKETVCRQVIKSRTITLEFSGSYYTSRVYVTTEVRVTLYSELEYICRGSNTNSS